MLFKKKRPITTNKTKHSPDNPYLSARAEWDDRYWCLAQSKRNWQIACAVIGGIALILTMTNAKLSTSSHVLPIAVETCQGTPIGLLPVQLDKTTRDSLVKFALNQFILNARTIVADNDAEKALLDKVYAYSADATLPFLADYYSKHDPFVMAARTTANVTILDSMPISPTTWQITFDVAEKGEGENHSKSRWLATLTYKQGEVNPKYIAVNPFGLYVTSVTWAQLSTE